MFMLPKGEEEDEDTWTLRCAARGISDEKEGCGFDSRDGCARRHLFEIPELVVVVVKMIRLMVMAPHSQGRRLQDKEERVRRGKNTKE